ncbi:hypothetical protein [Chitinivorax sp. B]|uniref:hypothetical protein n=1 Tax=Chitinivorax sp. B TaxID=2502235 RepID=UPI0014851AE8|nr:hypothetical protein [Chitinivorax sp. B]
MNTARIGSLPATSAGQTTHITQHNSQHNIVRIDTFSPITLHNDTFMIDIDSFFAGASYRKQMHSLGISLF